MSIILRKFNISYIQQNAYILIFGLKNSGKSTITRDIIFKNKDISSGIVISPKDYLYDFVPPIFCYNLYDYKTIKKFIKKQKIIKNNYIENDLRSFFILDDTFQENNKNNKKDEYFKYLCKKHSELNTLLIHECDNFDIFEKIKMKDVDFLCILHNRIESSKLKIYNNIKKYINIDFTLFSKLIDDYTNKDYYFLILDIKSTSQNIVDKLFWYKAEKHDYFKSCSNESWNYNNNNLIISLCNNKDNNINNNKKNNYEKEQELLSMRRFLYM